MSDGMARTPEDANDMTLFNLTDQNQPPLHMRLEIPLRGMKPFSSHSMNTDTSIHSMSSDGQDKITIPSIASNMDRKSMSHDSPLIEKGQNRHRVSPYERKYDVEWSTMGHKRKVLSTSSKGPTKLPRFHEVFQSSSSNIQRQPPPILKQLHEPSRIQAPSLVDSIPSTTPVSTILSPLQLKCKYRTGKCMNDRALKSCGDYHNLCNYHRLRANANQRKLDRKKKVQRSTSERSISDANRIPVTSPIHISNAATLISFPSLLEQAQASASSYTPSINVRPV